MNLQRKMIIVLAVASLAFAAGCSSEDDCAGDECVAGPVDPGTPLEDDSPDAEECEDKCAHLDSCNTVNDLECVAVCTNAGFSREELDCIGTASCRGVETCLDIRPRDPLGS